MLTTRPRNSAGASSCASDVVSDVHITSSEPAMNRITALSAGVRDSENSAIAVPNRPSEISSSLPMCRCLPT